MVSRAEFPDRRLAALEGVDQRVRAALGLGGVRVHALQIGLEIVGAFHPLTFLVASWAACARPSTSPSFSSSGVRSATRTPELGEGAALVAELEFLTDLGAFHP